MRGNGFRPLTTVTVTLAGQPVAQALTNSIGNFATGFVVAPGTRSGTLPVVSSAAGRQVASSLRVVARPPLPLPLAASSNGATLATSSAGGRPGAGVRLVARGLPPGKPVAVQVSSSPVLSGRSSPTGVFVRTLVVPNQAIGRHDLRLVTERLELRSYLDIRPANPRPRPAGAVTMVAAGDIACQPGQRPTPFLCHQRDTASLIAQLNPTVVAPLGDNQYSAGALAAYAGSFDGTWGTLKSRIRPAVGNHEYLVPGAVGYYTYFGAVAAPPSGYYSYDLGAWHVVVLNSNCAIVSCAADSPQLGWLRSDLASHPAQCTLAYFHHPRFSSAGHYLLSGSLPIWRALYDAGVDVVLNGHAHVYERFAPQNPYGGFDPARGIRQFTVGTGGASHDTFVSVRRNSQVRSVSFGVLDLTLGSGGYRWRYITAPGGGIRDGGSAGCH